MNSKEIAEILAEQFPIESWNINDDGSVQYAALSYHKAGQYDRWCDTVVAFARKIAKDNKVSTKEIEDFYRISRYTLESRAK